MKVILSCHVPFFLAHGGAQIQIKQTRAALEEVGVEVEYLRWHDQAQGGDVIHHFGRPTPFFIHLAHQKGMKFVISDLLTAQGSRGPLKRFAHKAMIAAARALAPAGLRESLAWNSYKIADAFVVLTEWEAHLERSIFGAPADKVHVVPNGVEQVFFDTPPAERGDRLVCTATITPRKRIVELAQGAVAARVPLRIIGKPYAESDPYHQEFLSLVRKNPALLQYEGGIDDRAVLARIYREARGFVLLSAMESLSLSALEAAACECPLLLSDLPWARGSFAGTASYCPVSGPVAATAQALREFHDAAPGLPRPPKPLTWTEVARQLKSIYEDLPSTSR